MSSRKRQENESQHWYCERCDETTIHVAKPPSAALDEQPESQGWLPGKTEAYRRFRRCDVCYVDPFATVEIRESEYDRLIRSSEQLASVRKVLDLLRRALNTADKDKGLRLLRGLLSEAD